MDEDLDRDDPFVRIVWPFVHDMAAGNASTWFEPVKGHPFVAATEPAHSGAVSIMCVTLQE